MNLNDNPTLDQLRAQLAACDDLAGHHKIWVGRSGQVHITLLPEDLTPVEWSEENERIVRLHYETFCRGNGYVGTEASRDDDWVRCLFDWLVGDWNGTNPDAFLPVELAQPVTRSDTAQAGTFCPA